MEILGKSGAISKAISGRELHGKFIKLGMDRRRLTNQLVALLPEIYERGIYKKYAATIVEYAGKFAGLSKSVVMKRLRIEKFLEGKPKLKELIASEGVHKVALVASLATSENDEVWADKVENMSKEALFELAKEVRHKGEMSVENAITKCQAAPQSLKITLEGELFFLFHKLKKQFGKHLSTTELLHLIFMESLEAKPEKALKEPLVKRKDVPGNTFSKKITRHNPVAIVREKLTETKGRCAYPGCDRPHDVNHHAQRYAEMVRLGLSSEELRKSLRPMCKLHHEFAHNGLIQDELEEAENWVFEMDKTELSWIDQNYRKWRKAGIN